MKAKKLIVLFFSMLASICNAGIIHHTLISITEQKILHHNFKHVMTSGSVEKDEFSVDGYVVSQENYTIELDKALKKEHEQEVAQQQEQVRARLAFIDATQVQIVAKLLQKLLDNTAQLLHKVSNPALEKFFVFSGRTIDSAEQLAQLKNFTQQLVPSIQNKIENNDFEGLNLFYTKLEHWPARLEKFFQDTVQSAIKKSDDTVMLKELLKLVSELS